MLVVCQKCRAQEARMSQMWVYVLVILAREENHDVLCVAKFGEACRDGGWRMCSKPTELARKWYCRKRGCKVRVQEWKWCNRIVGRWMDDPVQRRRLLCHLYQIMTRIDLLDFLAD